MLRLLLVRHASTPAVRSACFGADEPLDKRGREEAAALTGRLPGHARFLVGPSLPAFQTASVAGCAPLVVDESLADCDYGRWSGRALDEVRNEEPDAVADWLTNLDAAPHGGESLRSLQARVVDWIDAQAARERTVVAVTVAPIVRAAVVHALGAPPEALWRIDVAPGSVTEVHIQQGRLRVTGVNQRWQ